MIIRTRLNGSGLLSTQEPWGVEASSDWIALLSGQIQSHPLGSRLLAAGLQ